MAPDRAQLPAEEVLRQYMAGDERGVLIAGMGRRVHVMNPAARSLLAFSGDLPRRVGEVVHDMNVEFAVGDVFHDRGAAEYDSYAPEPDRLLRYRLIPVLDAAGAPIWVVVTVEDITRVRHLETVRRDFVANVSHELRTPLASMRLLVETLQNGALDDQEAALHFLHRIEVEVDAMHGLVEELLELSRLESGVLRLEVEPVPLVSLLQEVRNRLAPMAEEKGVMLRVDVAPLPDVLADPRRVEQVLMNLMHNGIKFTPREGMVTVRARRVGRGVEVEVADTGPGMVAAEAGRIFERFYKVDQGRSRDSGTGLGLAIARHLVELHGGRLLVVSDVGRGTRFTFTLPAARPQPTQT